jgi:hypothetical protein
MAAWHASRQILAVALVAVLSPQQGARPTPIPAARVHETLISESPRGSDIKAIRLVLGDAVRHVASVEEANHASIVRLDGKQVGNAYEAVKYPAFLVDYPLRQASAYASKYFCSDDAVEWYWFDPARKSATTSRARAISRSRWTDRR